MDFSSGQDEQRDRVAIVAFNDTAWLEADLTDEVTRLHRAINRLSDRVAEGTRLDLGLEAAIQVLQDTSHHPENAPVLILLTDGLPNRVPTPVPSGTQEDTVLTVANRAHRLGIRVYTIGLGQADAPDPADRIHADLLRAVARQASRYFETPNAEDLATIYTDIAQAIRCPAEELWGQRP